MRFRFTINIGFTKNSVYYTVEDIAVHEEEFMCLLQERYRNTSSLDVVRSTFRALEHDGSTKRSRKLRIDGMTLMKIAYGCSERYGDLSTCREGG